MSTHQPPRAWSTVNFPMAGFFWFVGGLWLALFALSLAITAGVGIWGEVDSSVWEQAGEIVRFFALFMVAWLIYTYLPIYVAHGITRREFMMKLTVFVAAFSTLLAALETLGFVLERLVYSIADWPQELTDEHVFSSPTDLPAIFLAYWLAFLVWAAVGAFGAASFYREDGGWGLVALPVGIILLLPTGFAIGSFDVPWVNNALETDTEGLPLATALCLMSAAAGLGFAWALIRDMPIRSKTA